MKIPRAIGTGMLGGVVVEIQPTNVDSTIHGMVYNALKLFMG